MSNEAAQASGWGGSQPNSQWAVKTTSVLGDMREDATEIWVCRVSGIDTYAQGGRGAQGAHRIERMNRREGGSRAGRRAASNGDLLVGDADVREGRVECGEARGGPLAGGACRACRASATRRQVMCRGRREVCDPQGQLTLRSADLVVVSTIFRSLCVCMHVQKLSYNGAKETIIAVVLC